MASTNGNGNGHPQPGLFDVPIVAPPGGFRIGGENIQAGAEIPQRYRRVLEEASRPRDPAIGITDTPPNFGRPVLPHVFTFSGILTTLSRAYRNSDEAIQDSVENANMMWNDLAVSGPLFARMMMVSLLNWHIEPEDSNDPELAAVADEMTQILSRIPHFVEYRRCLLEAIWYGRAGVQNQYAFHTNSRGKRRTVIKKWTPVHGDKIVFRYDDGSGEFDPDQIGLRVSPAHVKNDAIAGKWQVEYYGDGSVIFLEDWERSRISLHRHFVQDAPFEDPDRGGRVHGVGLRNYLYWTWYQKQETLAALMELIERQANGFTIYYYPHGHNEDRKEMEKIAAEQGRTNVIVMPFDPANPMGPRIEQIPPNTGGVDALRLLIDGYFQDQITRFILGQTLSTKAAATGLGSGVANLHHDSLMQIVKYDAVNLEETITRELLHPMLAFNYPKYRNHDFWFRIATEAAIPHEELAAIERAFQMGAAIRESDVLDRIGLATPAQNENALVNPQVALAKLQAKQMADSIAMQQMQMGAALGAAQGQGPPPGPGAGQAAQQAGGQAGGQAEEQAGAEQGGSPGLPLQQSALDEGVKKIREVGPPPLSLFDDSQHGPDSLHNHYEQNNDSQLMEAERREPPGELRVPPDGSRRSATHPIPPTDQTDLEPQRNATTGSWGASQSDSSVLGHAHGHGNPQPLAGGSMQYRQAGSHDFLPPLDSFYNDHSDHLRGNQPGSNSIEPQRNRRQSPDRFSNDELHRVGAPQQAPKMPETSGVEQGEVQTTGSDEHLNLIEPAQAELLPSKNSELDVDVKKTPTSIPGASVTLPAAPASVPATAKTLLGKSPTNQKPFESELATGEPYKEVEVPSNNLPTQSAMGSFLGDELAFDTNAAAEETKKTIDRLRQPDALQPAKDWDVNNVGRLGEASDFIGSSPAIDTGTSKSASNNGLASVPPDSRLDFTDSATDSSVTEGTSASDTSDFFDSSDKPLLLQTGRRGPNTATIPTIHSEKPRRWKRTDGRETEASLVSIDRSSGTVSLRSKNGVTGPVPVKALSDDDLDYLAKQNWLDYFGIREFTDKSGRRKFMEIVAVQRVGGKVVSATLKNLDGVAGKVNINDLSIADQRFINSYYPTIAAQVRKEAEYDVIIDGRKARVSFGRATFETGIVGSTGRTKPTGNLTIKAEVTYDGMSKKHGIRFRDLFAQIDLQVSGTSANSDGTRVENTLATLTQSVKHEKKHLSGLVAIIQALETFVNDANDWLQEQQQSGTLSPEGAKKAARLLVGFINDNRFKKHIIKGHIIEVDRQFMHVDFPENAVEFKRWKLERPSDPGYSKAARIAAKYATFADMKADFDNKRKQWKDDLTRLFDYMRQIITLPSREWTDLQGRKVEAVFVRRDGDHVTLRKKDGSVIKAPFTQLSNRDQSFINYRLQFFP